MTDAEHRERSLVLVVVRETAVTVKIMGLVLWHALRYPTRTSVVDAAEGTVRLSDADDE